MKKSYLKVEKYRFPEKEIDSENNVAVAVDVGCEFTKVAYWNPEDGCSSLLPLSETNSIPTAIAYSVYCNTVNLV